MAADSAAPYFGRQADCESASDLFSLTPYDAYWKYYRARLMTGNSYLWEPRGAEGFKVGDIEFLMMQPTKCKALNGGTMHRDTGAHQHAKRPLVSPKQVWIHRFRWHADTVGLLHDEVQAARTATCVRKEAIGASHEQTVEVLSSIVERLQADQHIDVSRWSCAVAHNPFRFPLPAIARGALLATRF